MRQIIESSLSYFLHNKLLSLRSCIRFDLKSWKSKNYFNQMEKKTESRLRNSRNYF